MHHMIHKTGMKQIKINTVNLKKFAKLNDPLAHFTTILHSCRHQLID